jgi:hypothetical protein
MADIGEVFRSALRIRPRSARREGISDSFVPGVRRLVDRLDVILMVHRSLSCEDRSASLVCLLRGDNIECPRWLAYLPTTRLMTRTVDLADVSLSAAMIFLRVVTDVR